MRKNDILPYFNTSLESILKEGARKLLQQAVENEVEEHLESQKHWKNESGHRMVRRNGYLPTRKIQSGIGHIEINKPRVRGSQFTSAILPRYMRRIPSLEALIPALYLKGVSTGSMQEALTAILGEKAKGLSATNIVRLKEAWEKEYGDWQKRDLTGKRYIYLWADGVYFNVRLSDDRPCLLVLIGALEDGSKELVAIYNGIRESTLSWREVFQELKARGLNHAPSLGVGDGALGFWAALAEEFPSCRQQRCWVHKTANVLDKVAKSLQPPAKKLIHEMYMAPRKSEALQAYTRFLTLYEAKYPKACDCLRKDKESLFSFYDFPAMHWQHIRSTNPIESTFATIRHRSRQTKGCGSVQATLTMVFRLAKEAENHWKKLRGYKLMKKVLEGVRFRDGEAIATAA